MCGAVSSSYCLKNGEYRNVWIYVGLWGLGGWECGVVGDGCCCG